MMENKRANDELRNSQDGHRNSTIQIQELSAKLVQMVGERDDLGRRLNQLGEGENAAKRRIQEYGSKITMSSQEI